MNPFDQNSLNYTNAIWDDGEWVSWDVINQYAEEADDGGGVIEWDASDSDPDEIRPWDFKYDENETSMEKLDRLEAYISQTREVLSRGGDVGRMVGMMGELYAEARFGMKPHQNRIAQGSDGKIGDDFVEVKTISPWKTNLAVRVKRSGHFNKLIVVRINEQWIFEARMIDRAKLPKGNEGKHVLVSWDSEKLSSSTLGREKI